MQSDTSPARLHPREPARALRRSNLSGSFVVGRYALSPYMACGHACAYCDGRAERYWVEGEFDRDIVVRRNLPDLLASELPRLREPGFITLGSGISDAYQPVEAAERLTGRCAEVLARHRFPVVLMTKSALALRDIDAWSAVNAASRFIFVVSLVHSSDTTRAEFEPGAASVAERIDALARFRAAGCATGVLAMPFLPGITDDDESIGRLYDMLAETGVDFIQPGGLTLRPGRQKEHYFARLSRTHPGLMGEYRRIYGEERRSGAPADEYGGTVMARALAHNARTGIPFVVPHRVYAGLLMPYDEALVLLAHMEEVYRGAGIRVDRLRSAAKRLRDWAVARKAAYNRHASWDYRELTEEILAPEALERILQNDRLATHLRAVMTGDEIFDPIRREFTLPGTDAGAPPG